MIETIIGSILDAVFASLAESIGLSDRLRELLGRDPEKLAFRTALTLALKDAGEQFPGRDLQYFAEALRDFGGALLARTLQPSAPFPAANELTEQWLAHLTLDSVRYYKADFERFAATFLTSLQRHLENQQPLQWITQLRLQKITTDAAIRMANATEQSTAQLAELRAQIQTLTVELARLSQINTDGGTVIGGNVQAGGHFAGRDLTIHNYLTSGLANLHINYSARIEEFLLEYLGSKRRRVPFGGRAAQLAQLEAWLNDHNAPPYYLMTAEAGRGKSALVCRWQTQVLMRGDIEVIFIPISIRFETATQDVVFAALAARLAAIHGEQIQAAALSADQWRATCQSYLRRELPEDKQLLLILDGLDEATGWLPGRGLLPGDPPDGLRVLVTARQRVGELGAQGWAAALGWDDDGLAKKTTLVGLDRSGVQEALVSMGNPLDKLATQVDVVAELYRLTEGDPLLMRLYVDALVGRKEAAAYLRAEELATIQPSLQGYFDRWWEEQHQQWRSEGRDPLVEQEHLLTLLNAVAAALGPLTLSDLTAVSDLSNGLFVRRLAQSVSRWLIGDGRNQGYTFSHPRLGYYFWEQMGEVEQSQWDARFTAWGAKTLEALNRGNLAPRAAPHYLVQHYASHLKRSHAPVTQFYTLLSDGWRQAWEAVDITNSGFLNDVAAVEAQAQAATNASQADQTTVLVQMIKAALCRASISALGNNITPELLRLALTHGLRTPTQALTIAQLMPKDDQRASTFVALIPHIPSDLLQEALAAARAIASASSRAETLRALAPHLPAEQQTVVLGEALAATRTIASESSRAETLRALAPHLPQTLLGEALAAARAIEKESSRAETLRALAPHLPAEQQTVVLGEALAAARTIASESSRAETLRALAPHLPAEQQTVVLGEALAATRTIASESSRAETLSALAPHLPQTLLGEALAAARAIRKKSDRASTLNALTPHLPAEQQTVVLGEALAAARAIKDEYFRARSLRELAPHLPKALLGAALAAARAIEKESSRASTLRALAPHLPAEQQTVVLGEALAAARAIRKKSDRASTLRALAPHLPAEQQTVVLGEALAATRAIEKESSRASTLSALAPHLPQTLLGEALVAARAIASASSRASTMNALAPHLPQTLLGEALVATRAIADESSRAETLRALAPHLPQTLLGEALVATRTIASASSRAETLRALAPHLPAEQQTVVLGEALAAARTIEKESSRAETLRALAPHLPQTLLGKALAATRTIRNESDRAFTLRALAPHLPQTLLGKALAAARAIEDVPDRAGTLRVLAPHLPQTLLGEALAAARAIRKESSRAETLRALAPHLPAEQQTVVLGEALAAARTIASASSRAETLNALAPHLPAEQQTVVLGEALAAARAIRKKSDRASTLRALAPHLPQTLLGKALAATRTIRNESDRAFTLRALAPHLPAEQQTVVLGEALAAARAIKDEYFRARSLRELAPHLPKALLGEALAAARAIEKESSRASTLSALAPHLPQTLLGEALAAARAIEKESSRAETLRALAPHLPAEQQTVVLGEALAATRTIASESSRAETLRALAPHLPQTLLGEALAAARAIEDVPDRAETLRVLAPHLTQWSKTASNNVRATLLDTYQRLSHHPRPEFLGNLAALLPVVLTLAGDEVPEVAGGIFKALRDVSEWWP